MKLFANGCSYTWGGGLYIPDIYDPTSTDPENQRRLQLVWPGRLARQLKVNEVVNLSFPGTANQRIVRTTVDYFIDKINAGEDVTDHFAVIQWTSEDRVEFYDEMHDVRYNIIPNSVMVVPEDVSVKKFYTPSALNSSLDHRQQIWYKNYHSDKVAVETMFTHICHLGDFFHKHKIPYVFMTLTGGFGDKVSSARRQYLDRHYKWIHGQVCGSVINTFVDNCVVSDKDLHPNVQGHLNIAVGLSRILKKDFL